MRFTRSLMLFAAPLLAIAATPAHADVKAGVDAWHKGDYPAAVAEWRPLAIAGDPDAQFNLGQAYKLGRGVAADLAQAETWYRRAASQGHLQAEDNLGLVLFTANRREEAMPYIVRSAARGEPRAQYVLGTAHFNGDLAARDWPRAYALTKRASDAGLAIASARLAQLDRLIPLEQRQAGLAMLPDMERLEQRTRLAAATAAAPPPPKAAPSPIKVASLPVSVPGVRYTPPPVIAVSPDLPAAARQAAAAAAEATTAANAAVEVAAAGTSYAAPPEKAASSPAPAPVPQPKPAPAKALPPKPVPAPAAVVRAVAADSWRAQLGAFAKDGSARQLWSSLEKKHPTLAANQPYLVQNGKLTRLQAGNFATRADADSFCAMVGKAGQACMVIRTK